MMALVSAVAVLWVGAVTGLADVAGFGHVAHRFGELRWPWIAAVFGGVAVAFAGYLLAYEAVSHPVAGRVSARVRLAIVAAGFGGFILTGGKAVDRYALQHAGMGSRGAKVRVMALHQLEQLPIALAAFAAALVLIVVDHGHVPRPSFVWPWALGPPAGALVVLSAARWLGDRLAASPGWRGWIGRAVEGLRALREMLAYRPAARPPVLGMSLYWAGELFAVWSALAAFGSRMPVAAMVIGFATGYVLSRRSAPLGGAGLIDLLLPLSLWAMGSPLAAALAGVILYRAFNLWLTLPPAVLARRGVRRLMEEAGGGDGDEREPSLIFTR